MNTAPRFRFPWRAYQQRVLDHLDRYRQDGRIHVVAPPGAGKTILGLEIIRRFGKPALVLAPSLTIRAQWAQRYRDDFGADPALISHDLAIPAALTIVTYQALFEYHKRNGHDGLDWVEVLVVDECHHLRNEWWRVLDTVVKTHQPELVALTATPPYDVSGTEWRRYHAFCGEIDEEISVPELVASGDLCPHQDYLYPVLPPPGEAAVIERWQRQKAELLAALHERSGLAYFLQLHPWLAEPENHYADIFEAPEYFTALLSVLRAQGSEPPAAALGVLHGEATLAPELNDYWAAVFLQRALRTDEYFAEEEGKALLRPFRKRITQMGAWQQGKLHLDSDLPPGANKAVDALAAATARLDGLVDITRHESEDLGADLRLVILTDHILAELLPTTEHDRTAFARIGTVPVFETLRRQRNVLYEGDICVLTGSLVIVPKHAESRLLELAYAELPTERVIRTKPLFPGSDYLIVNTGGLANKYTVGWITELFTAGIVRVIVGTKSLLGEGWDAPVINSLVLANTVGSFVLSNQMRGRAIRTVRGQPGKTANIWHPLVVHPDTRSGGPDVERLRRRFRAFAGPRMDAKPVIQNGLDRFGIDWRHVNTANVADFRRRTLAAAIKREDLITAWNTALAGGSQLVEAIRPPAEQYYEKKDPLTQHYRENISRYFERDYRLLLLVIKQATFFALLLGATTFLLVTAFGASWNFVPAVVLNVVGLVCAFSVWWQLNALHRRARELRLREQSTPRLGEELNAAPYLIWPVVLSLPLLFVPEAFGLYWTFWSLRLVNHLHHNPPRQVEVAARRYELLSDNYQRLKAYGTSLAATLHAAGLFHKATPEQISLEEDGDEMYLYLDEAEHHDTHQFAGAVAELLRPVENPRYLLRLDPPEDWTKGEYYLAVPAALGKRKLADDLARRLSDAVDHSFTAVYTREPAGRLHLLTARLQASGMTEAAADRDMLWR